MMALSTKMCIIDSVNTKEPGTPTIIEHRMEYKIHKMILTKAATSMPPVSSVQTPALLSYAVDNLSK